MTLSWLAPLSDGGSATLRYQYQRKAGSGSFGAWSDIPNSAPGQANVGSYTVMGLTNNVAQYRNLQSLRDTGWRGRLFGRRYHHRFS